MIGSLLFSKNPKVNLTATYQALKLTLDLRIVSFVSKRQIEARLYRGGREAYTLLVPLCTDAPLFDAYFCYSSCLGILHRENDFTGLLPSVLIAKRIISKQICN